jgi:5-methylcytosine-specific restriction endonuclease McrA
VRYTDDQLEVIFDRTDGHCHLCGRKMYFSNYAQYGQRGAWEVEHSNARCNGGSDRLCNLYAAHISCNREKGAVTTRTARAWNGRTKAPPSREKKEQIGSNNRWGWGTVGALSGAAVAGPAGLVLGAVLGALIGDSIDPE